MRTDRLVCAMLAAAAWASAGQACQRGRPPDARAERAGHLPAGRVVDGRHRGHPHRGMSALRLRAVVNKKDLGAAGGARSAASNILT